MIVLNPTAHWEDAAAFSYGYHSGTVGSEVEREPDKEPRRPIGFRFEKPTKEPDDPSWMLL